MVSGFLAGCGSSESEDAGAEAGRELAAGLVGAVKQAAEVGEPFRCAELGGPGGAGGPVAAELGRRVGRRLTLEGDRLVMGAAEGGERDRTLVMGVVADARGAGAATLAQIGRTRAELEREQVELVVSVGGMGTGQEELSQVLAALARDARWVVWAIPGERESIPAHRAAVAGLAAAGYPVFDGTRVRMVEVDGAVLASFPGGAEASQLMAGADGCVHRPGDASALAMRLGKQKGVRVWVGHSPPRQAGAVASDVALGGVHVGEVEVAAALPAARAQLVLHGMVDEAALGAASGRAALGERGGPTVLGSGPIEAMPIAGPDGATFAGGALVVWVSSSASEITWRRVRFPLDGALAPR
ncbi:MAG TPA: hypothetical protein VK698_01035 [Kofleriaceae bacterium]|nr:hypothetical protein [Kofleriaceae bacterium]